MENQSGECNCILVGGPFCKAIIDILGQPTSKVWTAAYPQPRNESDSYPDVPAPALHLNSVGQAPRGIG